MRPRLQTSGEIHRAANNAVGSFEAAAGAACHYRPRGNPDMDRKRDADIGAHLADNAMNLSRCFDCAVGIIPVCHGRAEYAHDVVPDMALDRAAIAGNCMIHGLEETAENAMGLFGVAPSRERGIAR